MILIQLSSFGPKNLNVCCTVPYIALASSLNVKVLQGGVKSSSMRSVHFPKQFASTLVLYKLENFGKPTVKSKKFLSQLLWYSQRSRYCKFVFVLPWIPDSFVEGFQNHVESQNFPAASEDFDRCLDIAQANDKAQRILCWIYTFWPKPTLFVFKGQGCQQTGQSFHAW